MNSECFVCVLVGHLFFLLGGGGVGDKLGFFFFFSYSIMLYFIICLLFSLMHRFQTGLEVNHLGLQKTTHFHYQIFIWHLSREMYVF